MSPPEPSYGESVSKLRKSLILSLKGEKRTQSLNEIFTKLVDVWNAIKQDNFIFAFRNSQAIKMFSDF